MARPTISYLSTTLTLPYPTGTAKAPIGLEITQDALGGNTRVQRRYRKRSWTLEYERALQTLYESVSDLWWAASGAGSFCFFDFTEVYADASNISVRLELSEFTPWRADPTRGNFAIRLFASGVY